MTGSGTGLPRKSSEEILRDEIERRMRERERSALGLRSSDPEDTSDYPDEYTGEGKVIQADLRQSSLYSSVWSKRPQHDPAPASTPAPVRRQEFSAQRSTAQKAVAKSDASGTAQVISLLNQLGERMIRSEQERNAVREEVARTHKTIADMESRLGQRDAFDQQLAERLRRTEALTARIEEAIAAHDRLVQRLEKTAQDRARILSKIEQIESSVEQTQNAIKAGGLVLLDEHKRVLAGIDAHQGVKKPSFIHSRTAFVASILAAGLLAGVALSPLIMHISKNGLAIPASIEEIALAKDGGAKTELQESDIAVAPTVQRAVQAADVSTDESDLAAYGDSHTVAAPNVLDMNDLEKVALMESDPDALAAMMNAIEPASKTPATETIEEPDRLETVMPDIASRAKEADKEAQPAPEAAASRSDFASDAGVEAFIEGQRNRNQPLDQQIKPDTKLPAVIAKIQKKAFAGLPEAQHDLAAIYTAGHGGVPVDYARAAQWFREAGVNGIANARYNLGVLYHQGLGVERDVGKAIQWYRAAAVMDHPEAQYNLGIAYIEGIGTEYDPRKAAGYFERAARGGVLEAAYNLGLVHENGLLGQPDVNEAVYWYHLAADYAPEARVAFDQVVKGLGLSQGDVDRIVKEYGAVYKIGSSVDMPSSTSKTTKKEQAPQTPLKSSDAAAGVAAMTASGLTKSDQIPPEAISTVIPQLSSEESKSLLDAVRTDEVMSVTAQIQEQLMRLGLYPGPADGKGGPQTEDAIRAYQTRSGLTKDGKPSEDLLVHMLANEVNASSGVINAGEETGSRDN